MPMSHGVSKKTPPSVSPNLLSRIKFSPGLFLFYSKHFINILLLRSDYLRKIMHFKNKTNFFFQLIDVLFLFCCFVYIFLYLIKSCDITKEVMV